jgi:hypothetical protein
MRAFFRQSGTIRFVISILFSAKRKNSSGSRRAGSDARHPQRGNVQRDGYAVSRYGRTDEQYGSLF